MHDDGDTFGRPSLHSAPTDVVAAVEDIAGSSIVQERRAQSGFTRAVASWIECHSGHGLFVKAAPLGTSGGVGVRIGAELADVIGDPGPPLIGDRAAGG